MDLEKLKKDIQELITKNADKIWGEACIDKAANIGTVVCEYSSVVYNMTRGLWTYDIFCYRNGVQ